MIFIKKNKKMIMIAGFGIFLILVGLLSWKFYFSRYKIFHDYEKEFTEAVEYYYRMNPNYLPGKGETRETTLQNLYDGNHIGDFYIPGTKKLCDSSSWVRVYQNEKGEYRYTTYLKCGRLESKVDHNGPEITLNGDSDIILSLGTVYEELGVKSVKDDQDGEIDPSSVIIDSSKLDINKVGDYKVTYTVRDKTYNKTVVTRNVTVAQNLTEVVRNSTDETNYYRGDNPNNYLLFSGMLWRIVNVNEDGSVKIVTHNNIANISYGQEGEYFDNSNIQTWLNQYFYSKLSDTSYIKEDSVWCMDSIDNLSQSLNPCSIYSKPAPVGLLTLYDYNISKQNNITYLNSITEYWLMNRKDSRFAYIHFMFRNDTVSTNDGTDLSGVRPAIVLKKDLFIMSGNGSLQNPYRLNDYKAGKENDFLNTRLIGEHVSYFGMSFRIADIDEDGYVKLVSTGYLQNNTTGQYIYASYDNESSIRKFNPNEEGNIGYQLNHSFLDYIDDSLIVNHEFTIPTYDISKKYSDFEVNNVKAKVAIPATYDIFSATNEQMTGQANYWLVDYIDGDRAFIINSANGKTFTVQAGSYYLSNGFKIVFYVDKDVKIKSGNGTNLNPYLIR